MIANEVGSSWWYLSLYPLHSTRWAEHLCAMFYLYFYGRFLQPKTTSTHRRTHTHTHTHFLTHEAVEQEPQEPFYLEE